MPVQKYDWHWATGSNANWCADGLFNECTARQSAELEKMTRKRVCNVQGKKINLTSLGNFSVNSMHLEDDASVFFWLRPLRAHADELQIVGAIKPPELGRRNRKLTIRV